MNLLKNLGEISIENIDRAGTSLDGVTVRTPLVYNAALSEEYGCNIYLKREDLQSVRSYKIRGAYFKMSNLPKEVSSNGVVCASAGNHAQGFALACKMLNILGVVYMPSTTPSQKVRKVKQFGKEYVEVILTGDTFDDAYGEASKYASEQNKAFIHPFEDPYTICGQGTVGKEILEDADFPIDYLMMPIGGGGLAGGVGFYFQNQSPKTTLIGVEPKGAPAMYTSIQNGQVTALEKIDSFVDGAAVKKVGNLNFEICKDVLREIALVHEGKICSMILQMYDEEAIVVEPAGALSIAALEQYRDEIHGKNVVCILSGGNNDITRTAEIRERSLLYEGRKHYFIIRFPQRSGALKDFLNVLGPNDDIAFFEYTKKTSRSSGPAVVGIELKSRSDYDPLIQRMDEQGIKYETLNDKPNLFEILV